MLRSVAVIAFVLAAACGHDTPPSTTGAGFPTATAARPRHEFRALEAFDAKLFGAFASHPGNFVYSPASLNFALAVARQGARGPTASEMDAVIGPSAGAESKALLATLEPTLSIANALFVDQRAKVEPAFVETARGFGTPVETVDFRDHPDASRIRINRWVAEHTQDRVRDLLGAGSIRRDSRLVVVDTIHMKAAWLTPFPRSSTKPDTFYLESGATKVETMHGRVRASMGEHAGARILDVPYMPAQSGTSLSMTIVLPKSPNGLEAVEADYGRRGIEPFASAASRSGPIDVSMPRFAVGASADLSETLESLGLLQAFTDQADFSGISRTVPLELSVVAQQAHAEVDETGTEASAATTGGAVEVTSAPIQAEPSFRIDRPFLFFIRDRATGVVLFSGRVSDPRSPKG